MVALFSVWPCVGAIPSMALMVAVATAMATLMAKVPTATRAEQAQGAAEDADERGTPLPRRFKIFLFCFLRISVYGRP